LNWNLNVFRAGATLCNLNQYEEALNAFKKAIELDQKFSLYWNNIGLALAELGRFQEAVEAYDKAIELDPRLILARNNRASCLDNLGMIRGCPDRC